jgi:hypothetical protein
MFVVDHEGMRMPPPTMGAQMRVILGQVRMVMLGRIGQTVGPVP